MIMLWHSWTYDSLSKIQGIFMNYEQDQPEHNELPTYYRACDVAVVPSDRLETFCTGAALLAVTLVSMSQRGGAWRSRPIYL